MKKYLPGALALAAVLFTPLSHAEYKWGFADIGIHYLDWTERTTHKTSDKSHKDDFAYLEIEGGAGFSWGKPTASSTGKIRLMHATMNPAANSAIRLKTPTASILAIPV